MSAEGPCAPAADRPTATTLDAVWQSVVTPDLSRLDAQRLLAHAAGRPVDTARTWLAAHGDDPVATAVAERFLALVRRHQDGEPMGYLLGEQEFHGLPLQVGPGVLVPRPDTETLVDWALECLQATGSPRPRVLDLGTGSGAIALALAHAVRQAEVTAVDQSDDALAVARGNAQRLGLPLRLLQGSWWDALPATEPAFDLVVSNPPYIAESDPHLPALHHEPRLALVSGADGLDAIRAILALAAPRLQAQGWLLFEHGHDQAAAVAALMRAGGWRDVQHRRDLAGHLRCTGGRPPDTCHGSDLRAGKA